MATNGPSAEPEGFDATDHQWFERLRGQAGPFTDADAVREADALGSALQQERLRIDTDAALAEAVGEPALQAQWQALEARLQDEGLLPPAAMDDGSHADKPTVTARPRPSGGRWAATWQAVRAGWSRLWPGGGQVPAWWQAVPIAVLVATVSLAMLIPNAVEDPNGDLPVAVKLRGGPTAQRQIVASPRQAAEALAAALRLAGLQPQLARDNSAVVVDAEVDVDNLPAARAALAPLAIEPKLGWLRVEFAPR